LANARKQRSLHSAAAADRIGADRAAMSVLPPINKAVIGWRKSLVLPRDHYVRHRTALGESRG